MEIYDVAVVANTDEAMDSVLASIANEADATVFRYNDLPDLPPVVAQVRAQEYLIQKLKAEAPAGSVIYDAPPTGMPILDGQWRYKPQPNMELLRAVKQAELYAGQTAALSWIASVPVGQTVAAAAALLLMAAEDSEGTNYVLDSIVSTGELLRQRIEDAQTPEELAAIRIAFQV